MTNWLELARREFLKPLTGLLPMLTKYLNRQQRQHPIRGFLDFRWVLMAAPKVGIFQKSRRQSPRRVCAAKMAALRRGVIEELDRLREALGWRGYGATALCGKTQPPDVR